MATRIEKQTPHHAEGLFSALSDPRIYTYLDEAPPASPAALRARLERLQSGGPANGSERWLNWTVFHDEAIAGYVQATVSGDGSVNIAYVLMPDFWGRGIAFEACRQMLAELLRDHAPARFIADADRHNTRSRDLLARMGFTLIRETATEACYAADPAEVAAMLRTSRDTG
ncbi:GNAT family N-acetyltransferase [Sinisalibacter aestuarii]|uniref:N-acetyltransferase domain-containing protein n=1 Tax=Sinisalibacter aestuarii TaxID=2949426 RepID=A0ABQ5LNR7_9RHOB|nr:GNAT family N-acetyltransferase [Sinisalibacter aestuarii]GKY86596.1 hypothetical protein STA1M1_04650 [Sinisalibacter aestuarii]